MALEQAHRSFELVIRRRHALQHPADGDRSACPGHDVFALSLDEVLAEQAGLAGCRIAAEADACRRLGVAVAEHHLHDVRCRTERSGDSILGAIDTRPWGVPGLEDRADRPEELLARVLWKVGACVPEIDAAETIDEVGQVLGIRMLPMSLFEPP